MLLSTTADTVVVLRKLCVSFDFLELLKLLFFFWLALEFCDGVWLQATVPDQLLYVFTCFVYFAFDHHVFLAWSSALFHIQSKSAVAGGRQICFSVMSYYILSLLYHIKKKRHTRFF